MGKKKEIWVLYTGVGSIFLYIFISLFFLDEEVMTSRHKYDIPFGLMVVAAVLGAPLIEEICFRGIFSKRKKIFILSLVAFPLFLLLNDVGIAFWICSALFYLMLFLHHKLHVKFLWPFLVISSSLLFAFLHYEVSDFQKITTSYYFLIQFGLGMIFVWLTVNYNILRAMFFHFTWNLLAMTAMFIYLQYPNEEIQIFENENIYVEWQRVPYFEANSTKITSNKEVIKTKSTDVGDLKKLLQVHDNVQGHGFDLRHEEIYASEPFMKYNFEIHIKDSTNLKEAFIEFLEEEDLIYEIPE